MRHVARDPLEELAKALTDAISSSSAASSAKGLSTEEEQRIIDECLEILESCDPDDSRYTVAADDLEECEGAGLDADVDLDGSLEDDAIGDAVVPCVAGLEEDLPAYASEEELRRNRLVKPRCKRPAHLNFRRPQFIYYAGRLHGHVRRWASDVFKKMGYARNRLPLTAALAQASRASISSR